MRALAFTLFFLFTFSVLSAERASADLQSNPAAVDALARCLEEKGAVMYGTRKCGHCKAQMRMFGDSFQYIDFVDCRLNSTTRSLCREAQVGPFPKWVFADGRYVEREAELERLAVISGCDEVPLVAEYLGQSGQTTAEGDSSVYGSPTQLAQCLKDKGVKFYGAPDCSHCNKQKDMFQGAFETHLYDNFHNCKGTSAEQSECRRLGTFPFPTWYQPNTGTKLVGPERDLEMIANTFQCTAAGQSSSSSPSSNSLTSSNTTNSTVSSSSSLDLPQSNPQPIASAQPATPTHNNQNDTYLSSPVSSPYGARSNTASNNVQTAFNSPAEALSDDDKVRIAKCFNDHQVSLYIYGSQSASNQQMEELGMAGHLINVIDCAEDSAKCQGMIVFPTWIINNSNLPGVYELGNLAQMVNCQ